MSLLNVYKTAKNIPIMPLKIVSPEIQKEIMIMKLLESKEKQALATSEQKNRDSYKIMFEKTRIQWRMRQQNIKVKSIESPIVDENKYLTGLPSDLHKNLKNQHDVVTPTRNIGKLRPLKINKTLAQRKWSGFFP